MDADETLLARCQAELPYDTGGFRLLVDRYEADVFATCYRLLGNREDAEEASQDTFLRVFRGISGFRGDASLRTWILRIARNASLSRIARASRRTRLERIAPPDADIDQEGEQESPASDRVQAILMSMSPADREVLTLRFAADLTLEDIAATVGTSLSAAKMRLYRAEDRFRRLYADEPTPM